MKKGIPFITLLILSVGFTQCGKETTTETPAITVTTSDFSTSVAENPTAGAVLGSVTGSTNNGNVTFSLTSESVAGAMSVNSDNGQLTVANESIYDFETNPTITGTVEVANGSIKKTANITITLTDVDEGSTLTISDITVSISENPSVGDEIGGFTASTNGTSLSYTLISQSIAGAVSLDPSLATLKVADASVFDFETNTTITGVIEVTDQVLTKSANFTINITDIDETPAQIIWTGAKITFTKAANVDPMDPANQDKLTDKIIIARLNTGGQLFNLVTETSADQSVSPAGTEWAAGTTADLSTLTFGNFRALGKPRDVLSGNDFVLKLIEENIFIDVKFISWGQSKNGAFSYERSTPN